MPDTTHLAALESRLSRQRARLDLATTTRERCLRAAWVAQMQREVESERAFLGMPPSPELTRLADDELLAELLAGGAQAQGGGA